MLGRAWSENQGKHPLAHIEEAQGQGRRGDSSALRRGAGEGGSCAWGGGSGQGQVRSGAVGRRGGMAGPMRSRELHWGGGGLPTSVGGVNLTNSLLPLHPWPPKPKLQFFSPKILQKNFKKNKCQVRKCEKLSAKESTWKSSGKLEFVFHQILTPAVLFGSNLLDFC